MLNFSLKIGDCARRAASAVCAPGDGSIGAGTKAIFTIPNAFLFHSYRASRMIARKGIARASLQSGKTSLRHGGTARDGRIEGARRMIRVSIKISRLHGPAGRIPVEGT